MDILGMVNKLLGKGSIEEQCTDLKVLALRSETIRKIDCAMTVNNTVDPLIKVIGLNVFIYVTAMIAFVLFGLLGLFICLLGAGFNLFYSRSQTNAMILIKNKYKFQ